MSRPAAMYTYCTQGTLCAKPPEKGRWSVEGEGETERHDCVHDTCTCYVCVHGLCVVHVIACCAALRCAALRVASRRACRIAHASLECEPRRLRVRLRGVRRLPHPNPKGRHVPTARRLNMHQHTTCLTPTDLPGERLAKGPGGSTTQRSLSKPLLSAASWIWSCEGQKNSEATRQDGKMHEPKVLTNTCRKSLHLAGTPQHEIAANTAKIPRWRGGPR